MLAVLPSPRMPTALASPPGCSSGRSKARNPIPAGHLDRPGSSRYLDDYHDGTLLTRLFAQSTVCIVCDGPDSEMIGSLSRRATPHY
ncbi:hypothetical protein DTO027B5_5425 [Paecilomyces variotii]|nr:hypothetical protein DTO027B5_5425 [Paecilomyces variotii]